MEKNSSTLLSLGTTIAWQHDRLPHRSPYTTGSELQRGTLLWDLLATVVENSSFTLLSLMTAGTWQHVELPHQPPYATGLERQRGSLLEGLPAPAVEKYDFLLPFTTAGVWRHARSPHRSPYTTGWNRSGSVEHPGDAPVEDERKDASHLSWWGIEPLAPGPNSTLTTLTVLMYIEATDFLR